MDTVVLGRTGLTVSVVGLGTGGHSRIGQSTGSSEEESTRLVHRALDLGVNYFDTSVNYGTERLLGRALAGHRDEVVISTKCSVHTYHDRTVPETPKGIRKSVHDSLERLGTDRIDVFHFHGVVPEEYDHALELVPVLDQLKAEGCIRHVALSEAFSFETEHRMLSRAVEDDCWDVMMVAFNPMNQTARERVFPRTITKDIGVEIMFAVRRTLSRPDELSALVRELVQQGLVDGDGLDLDDPLGFLVHEGGAESVVDAAYRFARYEPGSHVVLSGTGSIEHLEANVRSLNRPPLPAADVDRLRALFGHLDHISGNGGIVPTPPPLT
jgi:aryl-alcohol dehydrogenase-like predicted oxidoreductase